MAVTIPELVERLSAVDPQAQLAMYVDRRIVSIHQVVHMPGTPYVFLCEKTAPSSQCRYTESENGLIGYCAANGIGDEIVATLLGRTLDGIMRQRKRLGF